MLRVVEEVGGAGLLDDVAGLEDHDAVGQLGHHAHVVGDEQDGGADPVAQPPEQGEDLGLHGDVERGRRLVGQQQRGLVGQRQREHDPLLLTSGELVGVGVHPLLGVGDLDLGEQLDRPAAGLGPADRPWARSASRICQPTVRTGLSAVCGSWKTIATWAPRTFVQHRPRGR